MGDDLTVESVKKELEMANSVLNMKNGEMKSFNEAIYGPNLVAAQKNGNVSLEETVMLSAHFAHYMADQKLIPATEISEKNLQVMKEALGSHAGVLNHLTNEEKGALSIFVGLKNEEKLQMMPDIQKLIESGGLPMREGGITVSAVTPAQDDKHRLSSVSEILAVQPLTETFSTSVARTELPAEMPMLAMSEASAGMRMRT